MFVMGILSSLTLLGSLAPVEDDTTYTYNVRICAVFLMSSVYFANPEIVPFWWVVMTVVAYTQLWTQFLYFFNAILKSTDGSPTQKIDSLLYPLTFYIATVTMFGIAVFESRDPKEAELALTFANIFTTLTAGSLYSSWRYFYRD